jgi:hypothetical protein
MPGRAPNTKVHFFCKPYAFVFFIGRQKKAAIAGGDKVLNHVLAVYGGYYNAVVGRGSYAPVNNNNGVVGYKGILHTIAFYPHGHYRYAVCVEIGIKVQVGVQVVIGRGWKAGLHQGQPVKWMRVHTAKLFSKV